MLIPESRGDVLGVLETLDDVIDLTEKVVEHFSIEKTRNSRVSKRRFPGTN